MEKLRKYIDKNQKKNFIQLSRLPTGYPIIFISKKDGTLHLYINYRQLNNITIKNKYILLFISKFMDRLIRKK